MLSFFKAHEKKPQCSNINLKLEFRIVKMFKCPGEEVESSEWGLISSFANDTPCNYSWFVFFYLCLQTWPLPVCSCTNSAASRASSH